MLPIALLPQTATHTRPSALLSEGTAVPFSGSASWTSTEPALVQLVSNVTGAGITVSVAGSLNGVTQSEDIWIAPGGSGVVRGLSTWDAVTAISSLSISGATLSVSMIWPSGQPAIVQQTITSSVKMRKQQHRFPFLVEGPQGPILKQKWLAFANDFDARPGDWLTLNDGTFEIEAVEQVYNKNKLNHLEIELHKLTA